MSLAQQAGAVISPSGGKGSKGGTPRVPINNLQEQGKLLASLQQFVESKGASVCLMDSLLLCIWTGVPDMHCSSAIIVAVYPDRIANQCTV